MEFQIFGLKNDSDTRKAERFCAERRIKVHFVDLKVKPIAPGELQRFIQRFGLPALINPASKRFRDLGLAHQRLTEARWIELLAAEPGLLMLPLVRSGKLLSVGAAEGTWRDWAAQESGRSE